MKKLLIKLMKYVFVYENYYEIETNGNISSTDARKIGKIIANNCPQLGMIARKYISKSGVSRQIFIKII